MDEKDKKIAELEAKVVRLEQTLESEKKRLREAAGAWRRKVDGKGAHRTSLREGFNADTGMHYKVFILDIPPDLEIEFVLEIVKRDILPNLYPFQFRKIDYTKKYKGWMLEVERPLHVNMQIEEEILKRVYS